LVGGLALRQQNERTVPQTTIPTQKAKGLKKSKYVCRVTPLYIAQVDVPNLRSFNTRLAELALKCQDAVLELYGFFLLLLVAGVLLRCPLLAFRFSSR
jgi:hypothetical protein